jgi:hypothetical protein
MIVLVIVCRQRAATCAEKIAHGLQVWLAISRISYKVAACEELCGSYPLMAGPSIVLDLRFRVVRPEQEIFIVFPGQNYALYQYFVTLSHIFPELPALDLVPNQPIAKQPDLDAKLLRSRAIDVWYSAGRKDDDQPSRLLSDYKGRRSPKWLPNTRGVLMGFFERAKKGDLVVVPPSSIFSRVLIGELQDDNFEEITVPDVWDREKVPSRRVRWLATPLRGECSIELQKRFPSPNAVRILDREARAEVYSMAYGSYSIEDSFTSKFDVTSADFSTIDDYRLQQLLNAIAALSEMYGKPGAQLAQSKKTIEGTTGWDEIIALLTDPNYIPDLAVDISSPGSLTLSCRKAIPFVAQALIALTVLGSDTVWTAVQAQQVTVQNSQAPAGDACTSDVAKEVLEHINMMGYARWQQMCKQAEALRKSTGLKEQSTAKKK